MPEKSPAGSKDSQAGSGGQKTQQGPGPGRSKSDKNKNKKTQENKAGSQGPVDGEKHTVGEKSPAAVPVKVEGVPSAPEIKVSEPEVPASEPSAPEPMKAHDGEQKPLAATNPPPGSEKKKQKQQQQQQAQNPPGTKAEKKKQKEQSQAHPPGPKPEKKKGQVQGQKQQQQQQPPGSGPSKKSSAKPKGPQKSEINTKEEVFQAVLLADNFSFSIFGPESPLRQEVGCKVENNPICINSNFE
jgi:hypothetical protein